MRSVASDEAMDKDLVALQRCAVQPEACRRDLKHGCLSEVAGRTCRLRVRVLDRLGKRGLALIGKLASWNLYRVSRHPTATPKGHAEAIEIIFDPAVVGYPAILERFFQVQDPTTCEQQGSDFGPSYRSAIFYTDEQQKETALATIAEIETSGLWPGPVVKSRTAEGQQN
jgi:hypothetical protein